MNRTRLNWAVSFTLLGLWGCGSSNSTSTPQAPSVPTGYVDLCSAEDMTCQVADSPPNLKGTYTGTGTTIVTSNSIWAVGSSTQFTAVIETQTGDSGSGYFEIDSYRLDVPQATILGSLTAFTIYGVDSAVENDPDAGVPVNCSVEARGVVTGTQTTANGETTLAGNMILQFTKNIVGSGCTQDQINDYPGTGATFKYTATRSP